MYTLILGKPIQYLCLVQTLTAHCSLLIAHYSLLITQNLRSSVASVSSVCHWKFFTKTHFCINPVGKLKMPSWKNIISQQENYFFSVGKSKFCSRAFGDTVLGSFLNYFIWFLFILTPSCNFGKKVKMFDIERWAVSCEKWVVSNERWAMSEYRLIHPCCGFVSLRFRSSLSADKHVLIC